MASNTLSTTTPAQQPGLRSFIVYDTLPVGCEAFEIDCDDVAPHLRAGDVAIIDLSDREPMHGELFVIRWSSGRARPIEVRRPEFQIVGDDTAWWSASMWTTMAALEGGRETRTRFSDGPYPEPIFREKLVGKIVGILADAREMA